MENRVRGGRRHRGGRHGRDPRVDEDGDAGRGGGRGQGRGDPLRGGSGGQRGRHPRRARVGARLACRAAVSSSAPPRELADGKLLLDEPADAVVRLTISNPAKRNALDHPILDAISATLGELARAGSPARCVIVTGAHGMFSAGYDIGEMPDEDFEARAERLVAHPFTEAIDAIEAYPQPTLAVLPGHTIGGGLELALSCDLRLAQADIKLGMPPAKLGLVYSHTGVRRFLDAIGATRTRELFLLGRYIDADTALAWGLVNRVAADRLAREELELASELAGNAPLSQV